MTELVTSVLSLDHFAKHGDDSIAKILEQYERIMSEQFPKNALKFVSGSFADSIAPSVFDAKVEHHSQFLTQ